MFERAYLNFELDLKISSDNEIYKILKPLSPLERRDFLLSAILFYNHSPSFYQLHTFKSEMDLYLEKITKMTKHFKVEDGREEKNVGSPSPDSDSSSIVLKSSLEESAESSRNPPIPSPPEASSQTSGGFLLPEDIFQNLSKLKSNFSI